MKSLFLLAVLVAVAVLGWFGFRRLKPKETSPAVPAVAAAAPAPAPKPAIPTPPPAPAAIPAKAPPANEGGNAISVSGTGREALTPMMRVDDYVNVGRATPAAAFQTLIWAALKGDDEEFAATVVMDDIGREKAIAWRATLPIEAQAKFATVEKLPGLFLTEEIVRKSANTQVLSASEDGTGMATLRVRSLGGEGQTPGKASEWTMTMRRGPNGWGVFVPAGMIDGMRTMKRPAGGGPAADAGRPGR